MNHEETMHGKRRMKKCCGICGKDIKHLKSHMRLKHMGVPPTLQCTWIECDKMFRLKSTLKTHVEYVHEGRKPDVRCNWKGCERLFRNKTIMNSHLNKLHIGLKVQCDLCGAWIKCMANHMRKKHKQGKAQFADLKTDEFEHEEVVIAEIIYE